jgi:hypothetical protein
MKNILYSKQNWTRIVGQHGEFIVLSRCVCNSSDEFVQITWCRVDGEGIPIGWYQELVGNVISKIPITWYQELVGNVISTNT